MVNVLDIIIAAALIAVAVTAFWLIMLETARTVADIAEDEALHHASDEIIAPALFRWGLALSISSFVFILAGLAQIVMVLNT